MEEALLAEKCSAENRNQVFSINSFVGSVMGSLGALVAVSPQYLQESWGWEAISRPTSLCSADHPVQHRSVFRLQLHQRTTPGPQSRKKISRKTGVFVTKMSILGMVDNFGAGMAGSLVSYWFFLRFGVELKALGVLFFLSYFLAALSFLVAPMVARYLGVVRTMAFSHGLASMIYLVIPFAPTFFLAGLLLTIRSFLRTWIIFAGFLHNGHG